MKYISTPFIAVILMSFFSLSAHSQAVEANKFTGLELEEYFAANEEVYTADKVDADTIRAFNERYVAKDYLFTDRIRDNRTTQEELIEQRYEDAISMQELNGKELLNAKLNHDISDIEYRYGRSIAIVRFSSTFSGDIKLPGKNVNLDEKLAIVSFKTLSRCQASFRIEEEGLKTYRLDCLSDVIYDKPVPVKELEE